jgi:hypothetical protein
VFALTLSRCVIYRRDSMRRGRRTAGRRLAIGVAVLLGSVLAASGQASADETLVASGTRGYSPDSTTILFEVNAASTAAGASGTLVTLGRVTGNIMGTFAEFDGSVTCMIMTEDEAVVGASGSAYLAPPGPQPRTLLPGPYVQVLSMRFGSFTDPELEESPIIPFKFGLLGEHDEGVPSEGAPDCEAAPTPWALPAWGGQLERTSTEQPKQEEELPKGTEPTGEETKGKEPTGEEPKGNDSHDDNTPSTEQTDDQQPKAEPSIQPETLIAGPIPTLSPQTVLHTVRVSGRTARISFSGSGGSGRLTFRCSLDRRPPTRCSSPAYMRLTPGSHHISVTAVDTRGIADLTPAWATIAIGHARVVRAARRHSG